MQDTQDRIRCEADGFEFEAETGSSLMLALKATGFAIEASCEGSLACGTCHVRLLGDWPSRLPAPAEDERTMLASLKSFESRLHWHCHFIQKLETEPEIDRAEQNEQREVIRRHRKSARKKEGCQRRQTRSEADGRHHSHIWMMPCDDDRGRKKDCEQEGDAVTDG